MVSRTGCNHLCFTDAFPANQYGMMKYLGLVFTSAIMLGFVLVFSKKAGFWNMVEICGSLHEQQGITA